MNKHTESAVIDSEVNHSTSHSASDEILTSREACLFVKIGRTKLWELTRSGKVPAYRVGEGRTSDLRYKRSELLRWLDNNMVNGRAVQ